MAKNRAPRNPEELENTAQEILKALRNPRMKGQYQRLYDENPVSFVAAERRLNQEREKQEIPRGVSNEEWRRNSQEQPVVNPQQDLLRNAYDFLSKEKSRVANFPKATYEGKQVASKSPLTRQAEELRNYYANKGSPYKNKENTLLQQESQGFSPENVNTVKDFSRNRQEAFGNKSLDILRNQFRDPNAINVDRYRQKHTKDIAANQNEFGENLGIFGRQLRNTENMSNLDKLQLIRQLGAGKKQSRESLINNLMNYGGQGQSHENMQIEENRERFNKEANKPFDDIRNLEEALEPHRGYQEKRNIQNLERKKHQQQRDLDYENSMPDAGPYESPYINPSAPPSEDITQALQAYGITPEALASQQSRARVRRTRTNDEGYGLDSNGQIMRNSLGEPVRIERSNSNQPHAQNISQNMNRVAAQPQELLDSYNQLSRLHPGNPDENTVQRKTGLRNLVNANPMGNQIAERVPQSAQAQIARLERDAKRNLKGKLAEISGRYVNYNQHGSDSHRGAAAKAARELNENLMQMRNQIIENALRNEASVGADESRTQMRRAGEMGQQRSSLFNDRLTNINNRNFSGMQQFNNAQNALDRQYREQEEQRQYNWPHLREMIRGGQLPVNMLNRENSQYE